jgi:hypothetical protein
MPQQLYVITGVSQAEASNNVVNTHSFLYEGNTQIFERL